MPSERSDRVNQRRFLRNRSVKRSLRTIRTKVQRTLNSGNVEEAQQVVSGTISAIDVAARKGVIHPNKAARTKSRLARKLNAAQAST